MSFDTRAVQIKEGHVFSDFDSLASVKPRLQQNREIWEYFVNTSSHKIDMDVHREKLLATLAAIAKTVNCYPLTYIGYGGYSIVFRLPDGNVLRVSDSEDDGTFVYHQHIQSLAVKASWMPVIYNTGKVPNAFNYSIMEYLMEAYHAEVFEENPDISRLVEGIHNGHDYMYNATGPVDLLEMGKFHKKTPKHYGLALVLLSCYSEEDLEYITERFATYPCFAADVPDLTLFKTVTTEVSNRMATELVLDIHFENIRYRKSGNEYVVTDPFMVD